jgi:hypothetical protein
VIKYVETLKTDVIVSSPNVIYANLICINQTQVGPMEVWFRQVSLEVWFRQVSLEVWFRQVSLYLLLFVSDSYNITNAKGKVAKFILFKQAYKLGEDIVGVFNLV